MDTTHHQPVDAARLELFWASMQQWRQRAVAANMARRLPARDEFILRGENAALQVTLDDKDALLAWHSPAGAVQFRINLQHSGHLLDVTQVIAGDELLSRIADTLHRIQLMPPVHVPYGITANGQVAGIMFATPMEEAGPDGLGLLPRVFWRFEPHLFGFDVAPQTFLSWMQNFHEYNASGNVLSIGVDLRYRSGAVYMITDDGMRSLQVIQPQAPEDPGRARLPEGYYGEWDIQAGRWLNCPGEFERRLVTELFVAE